MLKSDVPIIVFQTEKLKKKINKAIICSSVAKNWFITLLQQFPSTDLYACKERHYVLCRVSNGKFDTLQDGKTEISSVSLTPFKPCKRNGEGDIHERFCKTRQQLSTIKEKIVLKEI